MFTTFVSSFIRTSIDLLATVVLDCVTPMQTPMLEALSKEERRRLLTKQHNMLLVVSNLLL